MNKSKTHSDFVGASDRHRWSGFALRDLFPVLKKEADQQLMRIAWRVLKNGALVALHRREDGRYQLRIGRRDLPKSDRGYKAFDVECRTFLREFGIEQWEERPNFGPVRGIAKTYVSAAVTQGTLEVPS